MATVDDEPFDEQPAKLRKGEFAVSLTLDSQDMTALLDSVIAATLGKSRRRAFWVPDDLWLTAVATAKARGESLSEVLREVLRRYVGKAE